MVWFFMGQTGASVVGTVLLELGRGVETIEEITATALELTSLTIDELEPCPDEEDGSTTTGDELVGALILELRSIEDDAGTKISEVDIMLDSGPPRGGGPAELSATPDIVDAGGTGTFSSGVSCWKVLMELNSQYASVKFVGLFPTKSTHESQPLAPVVLGQVVDA
jgi:hypothetical protein